MSTRTRKATRAKSKRGRPKRDIRVKRRVLSQEDAALFVAEAERLEKKHGLFRPEDMEAENREPGAPVHHLLEWDDAVAGRKWRLEQIKYYVRHVQVVYEHEHTEKEISAFVSVKKDGRRGYVETEKAFAEKDLREQVLQEAVRDLKGWMRRYEHLNELAGVVSAAERAIEVLEGAQQERKSA